MVNTTTIYVDNKALVISSIACVFLVFVLLILKTYFNTSFIVTRLNDKQCARPRTACSSQIGSSNCHCSLAC
jgi:hypothetical protein